MHGLQWQVWVSRVRVSRVNSVSDAMYRERYPTWPNAGQITDDPLVGCWQSEAGLVTDHVSTPGGKLGFLWLEFLMLWCFRASSVSGIRHRRRQAVKLAESWP